MLMRRDSALEWIKPPQQLRSRETLERLLDAAEAIILEQGVEAASVSAVAKRAKSSVGAFYARFPDKDALVRAVSERFAEQACATMDAVLEPARWEDEPLESMFETSLRFMLRVVSERRPLLTSLLLSASRDAALTSMLDGLVHHLGKRLHAFLAARDELPRHPRPELAVELLAGVILSTVEASALRHPAQPGLFSDAHLAEELTRICVSYLSLPAKR